MPRAGHVFLTLALIALLPSVTAVPILCYSCYGAAKTNGSLCANDRLVIAEACQFVVLPTGVWAAGEMWSGYPLPTGPELKCTYYVNTDSAACTCAGNLCNQFQAVQDLLKTFWDTTPLSNVPPKLILPATLSVACFECGDISVPRYGNITIPCDATHMCQGEHCVTKRGTHPHSYCGSSWEGSSDVQCYMSGNQPEVCVCAESLCNALYDPLATTTTAAVTTTVAPLITTVLETKAAPVTTTSMTHSTTTTKMATTTTVAPLITTVLETKATTKAAPVTTTSTTQKAAATTTTKAAGGGTTGSLKPCKNGRWTPNPRAVEMGEKMKEIINTAFHGVDISPFDGGIDTHICDYSATESSVGK